MAETENNETEETPAAAEAKAEETAPEAPAPAEPAAPREPPEIVAPKERPRAQGRAAQGAQAADARGAPRRAARRAPAQGAGSESRADPHAREGSRRRFPHGDRGPACARARAGSPEDASGRRGV